MLRIDFDVKWNAHDGYDDSYATIHVLYSDDKCPMKILIKGKGNDTASSYHKCHQLSINVLDQKINWKIWSEVKKYYPSQCWWPHQSKWMNLKLSIFLRKCCLNAYNLTEANNL